MSAPSTPLVDLLLAKLDRVYNNGRGWRACCPACGGRSQKLSVAVADNRVLVHCFGGCAGDAVLAAVGLHWADLQPSRSWPDSPEERKITGVLYGGGGELRLRQEAVLGVAGVRALRALGLAPTVWHINEGHAAFMIIERMREYTISGLPFAAALEATAADTVFTTHTPVTAGHDVFPHERIARQFASFPAELGITRQGLTKLMARLGIGGTPAPRDGAHSASSLSGT